MMAKNKPNLIIDGQALADPPPGGLDLENFIRALDQADNYQLTIVVDHNFPRQKPPLADDCPKTNWHRLDLTPEVSQAWSATSKNQRQQALNAWLAAEGLIGQPFVISQPTNPSYQPVWPAHSYKICLWPNQLPNAADGLGYLDLLVEADLILTPTEAIADELIASNLLDPERVIAIGQGGLSLNPLKASPPNPGPGGDFVLWPVNEDEVAANQLVAVAWQLFKKQTGQNLDLVVVGDISPAQKADIKSRVGRQAFFGRRLTAERLAWLYQQAAAVLLIRQQSGPLTPLLAALDNRRPVVANPTADLEQIAPEGIHRCDGQSILEIARAIDLALAEPILIEPSQQQRLRRDFNWTRTVRNFDRAKQKTKPKTQETKPTVALIGRSQLPAGVPGREIGLLPAAWAKQVKVDYFYEGRPPSQTDDNWLATTDAISYRPLIDLPGDQLNRYQTRVYYLANHPDCYQTLLRALTYPGIIVAPSLRFDRAWRQLVATGFISQRRFQLEAQAEAEAKIDDDCRGAWSLIKRSTGLIVENDSDYQAAKKVKKPLRQIQLIEPGADLSKAIANLQAKKPPSSTSYVDVSTLANNWLQQPRLTGIQRYEHHLLKRARAAWRGVAFVFWQPGPETLSVIAPSVIDNLISLIDDYQSDRNRTSFNRRQSQLKQAFMTTNHQLVANAGDHLIIPQGMWDNHPYARAISRLSLRMSVYQTIHDFIPIVCANQSNPQNGRHFGNYMAQITPSRPNFLTISKNTLKDLRQYCRQLGLPPPQTTTCQLGDNQAQDHAQPQEVAALAGGPFALTVGTIEIYKNHQVVLEAYRLAGDDVDSLPNLCVIGSAGWQVDELLADLKDHPKVTVMHGVNDQQLAWLYQNCVYTILPSFYEGWGLPVSESLAWGCPILCSNAASLPEVGGQLADYFDPAEPAQLLDLMRKYLDPKINLGRRAEIKRNYQPRSWAESIDHLLESVTGGKPKVKANKSTKRIRRKSKTPPSD